MLRLLLVLMALSLATVVQADVIYVEDFEDYQGNAGFDPMFNHSIAPTQNNWHGTIIDGGIQFDRPDDWLLYLYYSRDTITFDLQPNQVILSARIEVVFPGIMSCGFIGETGEKLLDFPNPTYEPFILEATQQEIGNISSLWIVGTSSVFNDITIVVAEVPEPSVVYGLIAVGLLCGVVRIRPSSMA